MTVKPTLLRQTLDEVLAVKRIPPQRETSAEFEAVDALRKMQQVRAVIDDLDQLREWFLEYSQLAVIDGGTPEEWRALRRLLNAAYITVPQTLLKALQAVEKAQPPIVVEGQVAPSRAALSG